MSAESPYSLAPGGNDRLFVSRFLTVAARVRMTSDAEHLRFFPIRAICEIRGFNSDSNRPPVVDARRAATTSAGVGRPRMVGKQPQGPEMPTQLCNRPNLTSLVQGELITLMLSDTPP
jgi:hypothetical protein